MRTWNESAFVFVSGRVSPVPGRVERRLLAIMTELVTLGAHVYFVCDARSPLIPLAQLQGVSIAPFRFDRINFVRTRSRLRKFLQRYHPVVAHSSGVDADLLLRWAAESLPVHTVNTVTAEAWPRTGHSRQWLDGVRRTADVRTAGAADAVVVDSASLAQELAELGFDPQRIVVDPPSVSPADVIERASGDVPHFEDGVLSLVGYAGRIEVSRDLGTLVSAAGLMARRGVAARVCICGEGPDLAHLKSLPEATSVTFIDAAVSAPALLKRLAVAVFPGTGAGLPTTVLEAAALGRPLVIARSPVATAAFREGDEALFFEPGDPDGLVRCVSSLIAHPRESGAMGERARIRTIDEYSAAASVQRHIALYRMFLAESGHG